MPLISPSQTVNVRFLAWKQVQDLYSYKYYIVLLIVIGITAIVRLFGAAANNVISRGLKLLVAEAKLSLACLFVVWHTF